MSSRHLTHDAQGDNRIRAATASTASSSSSINAASAGGVAVSNGSSGSHVAHVHVAAATHASSAALLSPVSSSISLSSSVGAPLLMSSLPGSEHRLPDSSSSSSSSLPMPVTGLSKTTRWARLVVAGTYGLVSFFAILANKAVLSRKGGYGWHASSALLFLQSIFTVSLMWLAQRYRLMPPLPSVTMERSLQVAPVALLNFVTVALGLPALSYLTVPTYTVLKRCSIVLLVPLEYWVLNRLASPLVIVSLAMMMIGAIVSSYFDLAFSWIGYIFGIGSAAAQAFSFVLVKKQGKNMDVVEMVLYNALYTIPLSLVSVVLFDEMSTIMGYTRYTELGFQGMLFATLSIGLLLTYSQFSNITVNSPITNAVVGQCKNVFTTVLGFLLFESIEVNFYNVLGLVLSFGGGVVFSYAKLLEDLAKRQRGGGGSAKD